MEKLLKGKKILLGITGGIAAYKAILLTRLFIKSGAEVRVLLTPSATNFVSPLVLATLSKHKVLSALADNDEWSNHVELGRWADLFIIAPLTCNSLAKLATGICDNLLMATYFSATCKVLVAPAMDADMWKHPSVKRNLDIIKQDGVGIIPVEDGELASGLVGEGRMAEPASILVHAIEEYFRSNELTGKSILINAGPTIEHIDPVRFISNHSSGKMGIAIAEECYLRGASVTFVSGPIEQTIEYKGIRCLKVTSASEMYEQVISLFPMADVAILSAAVADYSPARIEPEKIKKHQSEWILELVKTKDILAQIGHTKTSNQKVIGFALETENELSNAVKKMKAKCLDAIVLNTTKDRDATFGYDTNKITIIDSAENIHAYDLKSKKAVAKDIVDFLISTYND